jgi:hypothetical protein
MPPLSLTIKGEPEHFDDAFAQFFGGRQPGQDQTDGSAAPAGPLAMTPENTAPRQAAMPAQGPLGSIPGSLPEPKFTSPFPAGMGPPPVVPQGRGPLGKIAHGFEVAGEIAGSALVPNLMPWIPGTRQYRALQEEQEQQRQAEGLKGRLAESEIGLRGAQTGELGARAEEQRARAETLRHPKLEKPEDIVKAYSDALASGDTQEAERLHPLVTQFLETTKPRAAAKEIGPEQQAFDSYVKQGLSPEEAYRKVLSTQQEVKPEKVAKPTEEEKAISDHLEALGLADTPENRNKARIALKRDLAAPREPSEYMDWKAQNPGASVQDYWTAKGTAVDPSTVRTMTAAAPKVKYFVGRIGPLIDKVSGQLGPTAGRWNEFWTGKIGADNPDYVKLRTDVGLLQTMLMRMHVGARGGEYIMQHFQDMINQGKMSPNNLRAALGEIDAYADDLISESGGKPGKKPAGAAAGGEIAIGSDEHVKQWLQSRKKK